MIPPESFDAIADDVLDLYSKFDEEVLRDIVRRMTKAGGVTEGAAWQIQRLQESGLLYDDIIRKISQMSDASEAAVHTAFEDAAVKAMKYDMDIYRAAGLSPLPLRQSPAAAQVLQAMLQKTNGHLRNLTLTTALTSQRSYIDAVTAAAMRIQSGAFDYATAIRNAIRDAARSGLTVLYPSGHQDKLDVAVRRAVLTGASQTAAQISIRYADDMDCDLVETTAHAGARPSHQAWQGQVFSRGNSGKYPDFIGSTGYGSGSGLCGWNCRHSFYPYFEGLSPSAYPREKLQEYENRTVSYDGETMSYYDATQQQRAMERAVRSIKRELAGYDEGMKSPDPVLAAAMRDSFNGNALKLKEREAQLRDFLRQTGLDRQREREQVLGFGRSPAQKAVHAAENMRFINNDAANKAKSGLPKRIDLPNETLKTVIDVNAKNLHGIVPKGSSLSEVYVMAGGGTSTPISDLKRLYTMYPQAGPASGWQKKSGTVIAQNHRYVIHWYENNGTIVESKLKGAK